MSGHKRALIRLSDKDFRRLTGIEEKLRKVDADYEEIIRKSHRESSSVITEGIQEIRDRHEYLMHELSNFQNEISQLEQRTSQNWLNSLGLLESELNDQITERMYLLGESILGNTQDVISQHQEYLTTLIAINDQERKQDLENLLQVIQDKDKIAELIQDTFITCESFINLLEPLLDNPIFKRHWSQRFYHERSRYELARRNFDNGIHEAAFSLSQECFLGLTFIRDNWDIQWLNRKIELSKLLDQAVRLLEYCNGIRSIPAIGFNGEELDIMLDLEDWSNGHYSKIQTQLEQITNELQSGALDKDVNEFDDIQATLIQLSKQMNQIVYESRLSVLSSQLRFDVAKSVVSALTKQGFLLEQGFYIDGDPRQEYQATLRHLDGSEVIIQVSGEGHSIGETCLDIYSFDNEKHTDHERRQRIKELAAFLNYYGLTIGKVSIENDQFVEPANRITHPAQSPKRKRAINYGRN